MDQPIGQEPQLTEGLRWPAERCRLICRGVWRVVRRIFEGAAGGLRDDKPAAGFEERSSTLGDHRRPAEGSGQNPVKVPSDVRITACNLRSLLTDRDSGPDVQPADCLAQEGRPAALSVEEDECGLRPAEGDDEPGQSAPRAEVQEDRRGGAFRPQATADGDETVGVAEVGVDRTWTQEPGRPGFLEDLAELRRLGVREGPWGQGGHSLRWGRGGGGRVGAGHRRVSRPGR
jgi:hypothetical protein